MDGSICLSRGGALATGYHVKKVESAYNEAIERHLPLAHVYIHNFSVQDIFNADEIGLFSRISPDRKIIKRQLEGKKKYSNISRA